MCFQFFFFFQNIYTATYTHGFSKVLHSKLFIHLYCDIRVILSFEVFHIIL